MTTDPVGLFDGGEALWAGVTALHDLDDAQLATLEQACRQRDRADALAEKASTGDASALRHEREAGLAMTRLLAAMRLPDDAGRRPQARQLRGVQQPSAGRSVEDRLRAVPS